jgi:hypothetical protein
MAAASSITERLVLIGPPERLAGIVRLSNPGSDKLKIKSAPVTLKEGGTALLTVGARLVPGATQHVEAVVALDPRTPPAELHGEVVLGDQKHAVVLKVLERRSVAIVPSAFELHGAPGTSVSVPVVLTNLGNVAFELPRLALAALGEVQAFTHLFHVAMAKKGGEGHQAALDNFAQLLNASEVDAPKAWFGDGAACTLAPGARLETQIRFELPANLARHRLYRGTFAVGRTVCSVEIEVAAAAAPPPDGPVVKSRRQA